MECDVIAIGSGCGANSGRRRDAQGLQIPGEQERGELSCSQRVLGLYIPGEQE